MNEADGDKKLKRPADTSRCFVLIYPALAILGYEIE